MAKIRFKSAKQRSEQAERIRAELRKIVEDDKSDIGQSIKAANRYYNVTEAERKYNKNENDYYLRKARKLLKQGDKKGYREEMSRLDEMGFIDGDIPVSRSIYMGLSNG